MRCQAKGAGGWKWGESGKCFVGENAKEQALEQGRAIEASKAKTQDEEETEVDGSQALGDGIRVSKNVFFTR
jgi:hypothetical protein